MRYIQLNYLALRVLVCSITQNIVNKYSPALCEGIIKHNNSLKVPIPSVKFYVIHKLDLCACMPDVGCLFVVMWKINEGITLSFFLCFFVCYIAWEFNEYTHCQACHQGYDSWAASRHQSKTHSDTFKDPLHYL